jgi:hypothetical protein
MRQAHWSESIAVGSERFAKDVKTKLGIGAQHREAVQAEDSYALREPLPTYTMHFNGEIAPLRIENTCDWNINAGRSDA